MMGKLTMRFKDGEPLIELDYNEIEVLRNGVDDDVYAKFVKDAGQRGLVFRKADYGFNTYLIKPVEPHQSEEVENNNASS